MKNQNRNARKLMLNDIKRSGLSAKDANKMMLTPLSRTQTRKAIGVYSYSYEIPYFYRNNKKRNYSRYRLLENSTGLNSYRYKQKGSTQSCLYYPPGANHESVLLDTSFDLGITEGEKKVCAAYYKYELYTLGLGGVDSYQSQKNNIYLLDELKEIAWEGRKVLLIPDSDFKSNENVCRAMFRLATKLIAFHARVFIVALPYDKDKKIGLDDFFLDHDISDFKKLKKIKFKLSEHMKHLNIPETDSGNAELLSLLIGNDYRFATRLGK